MFTNFLKFSLEHQVGVSVNVRQFEVVFKLLEGIFNHPMLTNDMLSNNIENLFMIARALNLKLINTNQKVLALEPTSDFSYELKLEHKSHILPLLVYKKQNPDKNIFLECNRAISKMFPLHMEFICSILETNVSGIS